MAKQIARILKTDMMADMNTPALAQLLQKMGRGKDKVLAHITKEEAKLLKKRGGAGTRNPETGLLEFAEEDYGSTDQYDEQVPSEPPVQAPDVMGPPTGSVVQPSEIAQTTPVLEQGQAPPVDISSFQMPPAYAPSPGATPTAPPFQGQDFGSQLSDASAALGRDTTAVPATQEKGFFESLSNADKARLGLGIGSTGLAALLGQRGVKQAQQAATATSDIGKPYRETGQALQASALRGELTPAGQQSLQAAQAQLAQGQERRGGVGAQQSATQLATLRQNLLDQQYKYGLQVAQIGDQYAARAITQGLTGDQQMAQLMASLTGSLGQLFGNLPNRSAAATSATTPEKV